ncbi:formate dehydrogenase accessory sulfurtransferase FdhD [Uliginosibacterium sp. H1]|uniref:formate dehydrogenase accessory sulfurtransferase FdhD n=1 Tax=Uliginosibacterium sp. H1 TaxID=3114757 RepID=UPI002E1941C8|nr:formate dehydrogenase accessory sulfurtransferase FdhD [Uliginosibacterium sp. H1]
MTELQCAVLQVLAEQGGRPLAALTKQLDLSMSVLLRELDALGDHRDGGLGWIALEPYGAELSLQRKVSLTAAGEAAARMLLPRAGEALRQVDALRYDIGMHESREMLMAEVPVGIVLAGESFAVMMATPTDLEDFAAGLLFSEGLVGAVSEIHGIELHAQPSGINLYLSVDEACRQRAVERSRTLAGPSGCGLCGARNLGSALRPPRRVTALDVSVDAIQRARAQLEAQQGLNAQTGAAHAALLFDGAGTLLAAREDVGRHNALDKAIGACLRAGSAPALALLSSRASVELVQKCMMANVSAMATVSAPTAAAVDLARACGMQLWAFVREGRATRYA